MYLKSTKFEPKNLLLALFFVLTVFTGSLKAQLTGTLNIPGDYASLSAAITALNSSGVGTVNVTLNVIAGNPQTAPLGGYSITATGTGTNQIIIQGNSNVITAPTPQASGVLNDAFFKIIGGDYITITGFNMQENAANTTTAAATNNMTEFGVSLTYSTVTDGSQNISITSNTITLNRIYQNTFGIYANSTHNSTAVTTAATATGTLGGTSNLKIYSNNISNVNMGIVVVGPTAAADHNQGLDIGGSSSAQGNTISNYGTTGTFSGYASVSGTANGILVRNTGNYNISNNSLASSNGGTTAGTLRGIYVPAFSNAPINSLIQTILNNNVSVRSGLLAGTINGITVEATTSNSLSTVSISNNDFNTSGHTIAGASGSIVFITNAVAAGTLNVNGNTFTNLSVNTTGNITFISHSYSIPTTGIAIISNNAIVISFNKTGAGGSVIFSSTNGSSGTGSINNYLNNNVSNITVTGATGITGINNTDGGTGSAKTITGNVFNNWTGGTSAITALNVTYWNGISNLSGNQISNITSQAAITGINLGSASNIATSLSVSSNTVNTLSSTSAGGAVTGIACSNTSPLIDIRDNIINTLSSTGASAVTGIIISGSTATNVFRNKIYNLSNSNAGGNAIGITSSGGTTNTIYNNIIGDLRTPIANLANALMGINVSGGATSNIYYNTVYLNGTSSGVLFGSSAINASDIPTVNLRNNIFVNNSTPNGTGISVAYRRSSAILTSYAASSNNNLFYAGVPSTTTAIFTDGTTTYSTLAAYKTAMATRDAASVTENPSFASTVGSASNFLHFNAATTSVAESGANNIGTITNDFDTDIRQGNAGYAGTGSSPDIGADEFEGISPAPAITSVSITPLGNQCIAASRNVTANITPGPANLTAVTLNYSFNGVAQTPISMTGGSFTTTSTWNATIPVAIPTNANVTWYVEVTDGTYTKTSNGTSYTDEPTSNYIATASVSPSSVCQGNNAILTFNLLGTYTSTYCTIAAATSTLSYFNDFSTTGGIDNITNTSSGFSPNGLGSFTNLKVSQKLGQSINFNTSLVGTTVGVAIWVDWNQNGIFEVSERVYNTTSYVSASAGSFGVPVTAKLGTTRMRILMDYNAGNPAAPCGPFASGRGEAEDYTFMVLPIASMSYSWTDGVSTFTSSTNTSTVIVNASATYTGTTFIDGCPLSATVQINNIPLPTTPTVTNSSQCGIGVPTASVSGGTSYNWYATATSTAVLQTGTSTNYTTSIGATTTWYVTSANGTCESTPRVALTTTVSIPDGVIASTSSSKLCVGGANTITLTATQTGTFNPYTFSWDASPTSGSGMPTTVSGATTIVTPTLPGNYTYSVTATDGICTTVASVTVALNNLPSINAKATPTSICSGSNVNLDATISTIGAGAVAIGTATTLTGATVQPTAFCNRWSSYRMQTVYTATELTSAGLTSGNITSISYSISTLGDAATNANFTVKCGTTAATSFTNFIATTGFSTVVTPAIYTHSVGLNTITFNTPYFWDGISNLVIEISHDGANSINNSQTYYTTTAANTVAWSTSGSATGTPSTNRLNTIINGQKMIQSAGGLTWQWNPGAFNSNTATINPVNTGTIATTQVFTITASDPSTTCSNTATVGVLVNPIPSAPIATDASQCGVGVPTASVSGGTSYNWYSTPTSTLVLQTGSSSNFTSSINSTTTWYVASTSGVCESPRVALTQTVVAPPVLSVTTPTSVICANSITTLSITSVVSDYNNYVWSPNNHLYTDVAATIPYAGGSATTLYYFSSTIGNTSYTINANSTVSGCVNSTSVTINTDMPVIFASATPTILCSGGTVSLTANTNIIATGTANIGTGTLITTGSNGSSGNYVSPYSHWWGGYKSQYIIRASELQAAGLSSGNITSLSFDVTSAGTTYTDFAISMAATTQSIATTAFNTSVSQVYGPNNVTPVVGLNAYAFTTPFNWDGVSNIVVQICWSNNNGGGNAAEVVYSATSYASTSYYRVDNTTSSAVCGQVTASGIINNRPNIKLVGQKTTTGPGSLSWQWNPGAVNSNTTSVTPINTGSTTLAESYTVTALDPATTCTNSAVVNFSVLPIPTVTVTASSASICAGSSATLTASGATNYTWSPVGGTSTLAIVSPTANAIYTVTGSTSGCVNTATVSIGVNSIPTVSASTSSNSICSGSSATLTAAGATNYTWTAGGNASTEVVSPTTTSIYTVTGESNGCTGLAHVTLTVVAIPSLTATASSSAICTGSSATLTAAGATNYTWTSGGNASTEVVTPTSTSVYTVTGETSGCANTATVSLDVNSIPTVTAAASSASVCSGSTATLTAGGATNYTWTSGGNASTEVVTPTTASAYTVTGETSGCSNTAIVSVGVNQIPTVTATASQTLLCDNGSTGSSILTASTTATSFAWSDGANTMTTSVTPTLTTTYTVTVTEAGCSADAFVTVTVSNCNGVKELVGNGISVYPNPTNGILNISISSELEGVTSIEVYDAIGKLTIKENLTSNTTTINTSKLVDGIYVFKIINNTTAIKIGKIVKQ